MNYTLFNANVGENSVLALLDLGAALDAVDCGIFSDKLTSSSCLGDNMVCESQNAHCHCRYPTLNSQLTVKGEWVYVM